MNFGYGDILDYLMSSHRIDMEAVMKLDEPKIADMAFRNVTPSERAMMVLDFALNYNGPEDGRLVKMMPRYAGIGVLSSYVCGVQIASLVATLGAKGVKKIFDEIPQVPIDLENSAVARIVGMFKLNRQEEPVDKSMDILLHGRELLVGSCTSDKEYRAYSNTSKR